MHAKTVPNAVTVATGKISHTGTYSFLPELEYMKSILPKDQWKVCPSMTGARSWLTKVEHQTYPHEPVMVGVSLEQATG